MKIMLIFKEQERVKNSKKYTGKNIKIIENNKKLSKEKRTSRWHKKIYVMKKIE